MRERAEERIVHLELDDLRSRCQVTELEVRADRAPPQERPIQGLVPLGPDLTLVEGVEGMDGQGLNVGVPEEAS